MKAWLLCLAVFQLALAGESCWTETVRLLAGDSFTLRTPWPENASVLWQKLGSWDPFAAEPVAVNQTVLNLNLNIRNVCGSALMVGPAVAHRSNGTWLATVSNNTGGQGANKCSEKFFHVFVYDSEPVLVPLRYVTVTRYEYPQSSLAVMCVDLAKPDAYDAYLQLGAHHRLQHKWVKMLEKNKHLPTSGWLQSHPGDSCSTRLSVRCCSDTPGGTKCSPYTHITLNAFLTSYMTGWRRWCPWMSEHSSNLVHSTRANLWGLRSLEGRCTSSAQMAAVGTKIVCPGTNVTLKAFPDSVWQRAPFYGASGLENITADGHFDPQNGTLTVSNVSSRDSNRYAWLRPPNLGINFSLAIVDHFRAVVALEYMDKLSIVLKCTHSLMEPPDLGVKIEWEVHQSINSYRVGGPNGENLLLQPDCWHTLEWWHYLFAVRCHVRAAHWTATSDWFSGRGFKLSEVEELHMCNKVKHMQWVYRIPYNQGPIDQYWEV